MWSAPSTAASPRRTQWCPWTWSWRWVDLGILERRLERLNASLKGARAADRGAIEHEAAMVERVKGALEQEIPVYRQDIAPEE